MTMMCKVSRVQFPYKRIVFVIIIFYAFGSDATIPYTYRVALKILETLQIEQSSGIDQSRVAVKPRRYCAKYRHHQRIVFVFFFIIWSWRYNALKILKKLDKSSNQVIDPVIELKAPCSPKHRTRVRYSSLPPHNQPTNMLVWKA